MRECRYEHRYHKKKVADTCRRLFSYLYFCTISLSLTKNFTLQESQKYLFTKKFKFGKIT
ncbi:hypothetical protein HMPREF0262_01068 [Clostridium sp. ATCC 29733]|nr:hypothetical protein HMPREF0262_01068 [Clostridium sp. ATCC 29733]